MPKEIVVRDATGLSRQLNSTQGGDATPGGTPGFDRNDHPKNSRTPPKDVSRWYHIIWDSFWDIVRYCFCYR